MNLVEALDKVGLISPLTIPELRYLSAAAERVRERWPDVHVPRTDKEREVLAQRLREHVEANKWEGTRLSFVVAAVLAVFDTERRERPDLAQTREFLYAEIAASTSKTFLTGLLRAYMDSYTPEGAHTTALATALGAALPNMSATERSLLEAVPELMDPISGSDRLATRMSKMSDPYTELLRLGVRNPHGGGFMDLVHLTLTSLVRPHLSERNLIDWYIRWLRPPGKEEGRTAGAEAAIEALIHPWLDKTPDDKLRSYLVETLIELYGDPRIKSGGVWGGIGERYMAIVHRWLTREDMRFFTGVVDATQKDAMWLPRRDFWLKLYDEGLIDAAWAALSKEAFEHARQHLMRQDAKNAYTRVGYQQARQNTSLLIMKIGNKIMVDGCHSYRTHVFELADPMAPKLFEEGYNCDEIMHASDRRASVASKSHSSIPSWSRWVRDMINADVAWSQRTRPYTKVFRPRPPKPRHTPSWQRVMPRYADRPSSLRDAGDSSVGQDLFGSTAAMRTSYVTGGINHVERASGPSTGIAGARRISPENPGLVQSSSRNVVSLKNARFPSLTDRMIAYGPEAAVAVLSYLEAPAHDRARPALSPKSKEGLAWVREAKGDLPLRLRNALEYLLIGLKTSGVDLDDLFASSSATLTSSSPTVESATIAEKDAESDAPKFLPLPDDAGGRLDLLRRHIDTLEELVMNKSTFEQRKVLANAVRKVREQSHDLRPAEVAELQRIYEELRKDEKDRRK